KSLATVGTVITDERREENQLSDVNSSVRESPSYAVQARLTTSSALAAEAEASTKTADHALTQHSANSPMLGQLSVTQIAATDRTDLRTSNDESQLDERPAAQSTSAGEKGDDDGGMIELNAADLVRQKRKAAA